ncbi:MAG: hypothetical protein R3A46_15100 [Thermomicrobiales bacterium]
MREQLRVGLRDYPPRHPAKPAYPRADLGLPIIFQRLDPQRSRSQWELRPKPSGKRRMASPVILKPLMISATQAVPMVLILNAPHVWDAHRDVPRLEMSGYHGYDIDREQLQISETWEDSPMKGEVDARSGLLAFAETESGWSNQRGEI